MSCKKEPRKRNPRKRNPKLFLTLYFSGVAFLIHIITILVVNIILFNLIQLGIQVETKLDGALYFISINGIVSFIIGAVLTFIIGRFPKNPIYRVIDGMNQLAEGNYKMRLHLGEFKMDREIASSFNSLAEELENTEMLRSDFINNFSHEFKTPIVSIAGFAKLLRKQNLPEEKRQEYLTIIEEESLRLSYMATNVLNLTKVENQTIVTDKETYNLSEQIRTCVLMLERKWSKKNIDFSLEFTEHMIYASENLMKEVWINLIDNAVKFSPEQEKVEIIIKENDEEISVSVTNQGSEISEKEQNKIFNKFYQADESHSSEGNGVGLAIVKKVTELHDGRVMVESNHNKTIFTIVLPKL